jgi:putative flippase GtrA
MKWRPAANGFAGDAVRFIMAGAINTAISFAIYQAALFFVPPLVAYAISWIAGLAFLVVVYPERVFPGGRRTALDRVLLGLAYVAVFLVGVVTLNAISGIVPPRLAILFVLVVTTLANFLASRTILRR